MRLNWLVWLGLGMAAAAPAVAAGLTVFELLGGGTPAWVVLPLVGLSLASIVPFHAGLRRWRRENTTTLPGPEHVASNGGASGLKHGRIERVP